MSYYADSNLGRNVMRRVEVVEVDDSEGVQRVTVMGLADEYFELPLRGQPHGLTTVPPVGSIGYLMFANGRPDQAFLMGLEHPESRKKNQASGEAKVYAEPGQEMHLDASGNIFLRSVGIVHINPPV